MNGEKARPDIMATAMAKVEYQPAISNGASKHFNTSNPYVS